MRLEIPRANLATALTAVTRIVDSRPTFPILANVLLATSDDGSLTVSATDFDIEATSTVPCSVTAPGAVTMPAAKLAEIARKLPADAVVVIDADDAGSATVKAGRSRFTLRTLPADDFPAFSQQDYTHSFEMPSSLLSRSSFAAANDSALWHLGGVFLEHHGDSLRAVATDTHCVARIDTPLPDGAAGMAPVTIPNKVLAEISRLAGKTVKVDLSDKKIRFTMPDATITSKLIDGAFVQYERAYPANNNNVLVANRAALVAALARVTIMSTDRKIVRLELADNTVHLTVNDGDSGGASEEVDAEYASEPMKISLNPTYLGDLLANLSGDKVELRFKDFATQLTISDVGDDSALHVLTPIRARA